MVEEGLCFLLPEDTVVREESKLAFDQNSGNSFFERLHSHSPFSWKMSETLSCQSQCFQPRIHLPKSSVLNPFFLKICLNMSK